MNLYNALENLILEVVNRSQVESSIDKKQMCKVFYDGDETISRGWRWIEPYVLGLSKAGNPVVRVFQTDGVTDSEQPGWKTFRLDKINKWVTINKYFSEPISDRDSGVPKYNSNGDKSMTTIYKQAKF
jgi:GTPase SAR1 family protein